jgi:hypothetical protein
VQPLDRRRGDLVEQQGEQMRFRTAFGVEQRQGGRADQQFAQ